MDRRLLHAGLRHPDVILSGDLGVQHAIAGLGLPSTPVAVDEVARRWRPWRSYASLHLWAWRPNEEARAS